MADVIAFMYVVDGKTIGYLYVMLADVIAMVADGIATQIQINTIYSPTPGPIYPQNCSND